MHRIITNTVLALGCLAIYSLEAQGQDVQLDRISLPEGFSIEVYAEGLVTPRSMVLSEDGTLFVGTRMRPQAIAQGRPGGGVVYAIQDRNGDNHADEVIEITQGLNVPNGVALRSGDLYVAEINRILRYDDIESQLHDPPDPVVVRDDFPEDWAHGWKFIAFGPDDKLYVPVGLSLIHI